MLAKRIIPCRDVDNGPVVKGVKFVDIRGAGAEAVLAPSIFHFAEYSIGEAKRFMAERGVEVRL